jgi:hypothetical protein
VLALFTALLGGFLAACHRPMDALLFSRAARARLRPQ